MSAIAAIASRSLFVAPGVSTPPSAPVRSMYPVAKRGEAILESHPNPLCSHNPVWSLDCVNNSARFLLT